MKRVRIRPESISRHCQGPIDECAFDSLVYATVKFIEDINPAAIENDRPLIELWLSLQEALVNYGCEIEEVDD